MIHLTITLEFGSIYKGIEGYIFFFWKPKKRKQAFFVYFPARRAHGYAIKHLQHVTVCIMVCWITV